VKRGRDEGKHKNEPVLGEESPNPCRAKLGEEEARRRKGGSKDERWIDGL
jgi:hypothetical protein